MSESPQAIFEKASFGGVQGAYRHESSACGGPMEFSVYVPPGDGPFPVVFYLSGLTCSWKNFTEKAGAQRIAAALGLIVVVPDTSPRGAGYEGEDDSDDFGTGAGFYVDALREPWAKRYRMFSYVNEELPALIDAAFPTRGAGHRSVFGHSMGGHGALVSALRNPGLWRSASALSPIVAPSDVPWGKRAFSGYLGDEREAWAMYDACRLVQTRQLPTPILIDQGTDDEFLEEQLKPQLFQEACAAAGQGLSLRMQPGYDHSYYFIATFVEDHLRHHAGFLR
ncbi:MAG: S-formylglutathione hydrolase [Myxococcota bacterium]